ncbi:hypothetical protein O6H91_11G106100 [Diphasiastrum complanatum]|uniref:Uncharacterized protein n=1 Tax=Diphasiastrum complanatum TaxID=34168 RepID=A0ACC2CCM9_DIPCM|nr:hypothetical protein O6H91_11G106100 [Diphasiastrum complanatum]
MMAEAEGALLLGQNMDYLQQTDAEHQDSKDAMDVDQRSEGDGAEDLPPDHTVVTDEFCTPVDLVLENDEEVLGFLDVNAEKQRLDDDVKHGKEKLMGLLAIQGEHASASSTSPDSTFFLSGVPSSSNIPPEDLETVGFPSSPYAESLKKPDEQKSVREDSRFASVLSHQAVAGDPIRSEDSLDPLFIQSGCLRNNAGARYEQVLDYNTVTQATLPSNLSATVVLLSGGATHGETREAVYQDTVVGIRNSHDSLEQVKDEPENESVAAVECGNQNNLRKELILDVSDALGAQDGRRSQNSEDHHKVDAQGSNQVYLENETTTLAEKFSSEKMKTELELEMELFEAAEGEEQTRLISSSRPEEQEDLTIHKGGLQVVEEVKNERKRFLDDRAGDASQVVPKKRGRRRAHGVSVTKGVSSTKEEDDVCFVCFDGGELVLCDKRLCPKAYHSSCIGRDAAFFEKKGSWFCGWHFCCGCCRPANLQCYTCPRAYCVSCSKEADFLLIKKRKGLCEDCLPIVKMIESSETANTDEVQVDFDDPDTYECLFKEYWEDLKLKFSLKLPNIDHDGKAIENPGEFIEERPSDTDEQSETEAPSAEVDEEPELSDGKRAGGRKRKQTGSVASKSVNEQHDSDYEGTTESHEAADDPEAPGIDTEKLLPREFDGWASKDLLEFLVFMNQDPKITMSRFQVNKLLWNYIKSNKLQNRQKRTIIECDERLRKLFGKKSMHQHEMMKDIHLHYPPKGLSAKGTSVSRRRSSNTPTAQNEFQGDVQSTVDIMSERPDAVPHKETQKPKRKYAASEASKADSNEYAAIIPQNINLIHLRRALLEDLLDDPEFETKVVGTFVRIRVPVTSSKMEMCYRLVQVAGIKLQNQEYNTGRKTTKVVLEIMNLHKKEELTIDLVSNQDFTEEECHRLRQSVKCHFIRALTVGEIEKKSLAIRETKLNDWFETEILRVTALRDRANEKGRKKEFRECVEKLQKLSDPDFRAKESRRSPVVIADPHMNPDYESEGDEEELNNDGEMFIGGDKRFGPGNLEKSSRSSGKDKAPAVHSWDRRNVDVTGPNRREWDVLKSQSLGWEKTRDQSVGYSGQEPLNDRRAPNFYKVEPSRWEDRKVSGEWGQSDEQEQLAAMDDQRRIKTSQVSWDNDQEGWKANEAWLRGSTTPNTTGGYGKIENSGWNIGNAVGGGVEPSTQGWAVELSLTPSSVPTPPNSVFPARVPAIVNIPTAEVNEKEKLWHYKDPSGVIQGPFSMEQLKKWNLTGLFPLDLRIWKSNQPSEESILLTDALAGRFVLDRAPWVAQAGTHGTSTPSVPWAAQAVTHGTSTPSVPWAAQAVTHGTSTPSVPWAAQAVTHGTSTPSAPWAAQAGTPVASTPSAPWAAQAATPAASTPSAPWAAQAGTPAASTPSAPWAAHAGTPGASTPSAPWAAHSGTPGTSTPAAPWAAQAGTYGTSTPATPWVPQAGNHGTSIPSAPWVVQASNHGTSTPSYEADFKGSTASFRIDGRNPVGGPVMTRYGDGRQENGSNSLTEYGMETGKGNAWGRGVSPNQWASTQRPWGTMHNQGLGRGGGRTNWGNESGHRFPAVSWNQQTEPSRRPMKDIPCRFHQKGFCRNGDTCQFRHD